VVEALVRWDPAWFAARELADRAELRLPPTTAMAALTGDRRHVEAALGQAQLTSDVERLGPLPHGEEAVRMLLRVPLQDRAALARSMAGLKAVRSARKDPAGLQVRMDPPDPVG
jgi:primosomal protein N' (replication factor Y)